MRMEVRYSYARYQARRDHLVDALLDVVQHRSIEERYHVIIRGFPIACSMVYWPSMFTKVKS